jgi:hypothetical protein
MWILLALTPMTAKAMQADIGGGVILFKPPAFTSYAGGNEGCFNSFSMVVGSDCHEGGSVLIAIITSQ